MRTTETPTRIYWRRVLPAFGVFALLNLSTFWPHPGTGTLGAAECFDQYGATVACAAGRESESPQMWPRDDFPSGGPEEPQERTSSGPIPGSPAPGTPTPGTPPPGGDPADGVYHVRADGTAPGKSGATSCSSAATAMSPSTHNNQSFSPGDTIILCHEGGVIRNMIDVPSSGAAGSPISYTGRNTAVIAGSNLVSGWTSDSGNVYRANVSVRPEQVFINGAFGDRKDSRGQVVNEHDWYWGSNVLYLYSGGGDPDAVFSNPGVESGARSYGIRVDGEDHVTISYLTTRHAQAHGIFAYGESHYLTIRRVVAEWNFLQGIYATGSSPHDNALIEYSTVRRNGGVGILVNGDHRDTTIRNNMIYENSSHHQPRHTDHNWTAGIKMWSNYQISRALIEKNAVYNNGPAQLEYSRGMGIWLDGCAGSEGPNVIRQNLVYGNKSFGIFIEVSSNSEVSYNVVVDNAETPYTAGIGVKANQPITARNNFVHNNTVYGSNWWGIFCGVYDTGQTPRLVDNTFTNNIVVGSAHNELWAENACVNDGTHGTGNTYQFNSFGAQHSGFIGWAGQHRNTYDEWEAAYGGPTYSIRQDPDFNDSSQGEFWLLPGSPGVDEGLNLGSDYSTGLQELSTWPNSVRTANQDQHGGGWEIGAYVTTAPLFIPPPQ